MLIDPAERAFRRGRLAQPCSPFWFVFYRGISVACVFLLGLAIVGIGGILPGSGDLTVFGSCCQRNRRVSRRTPRTLVPTREHVVGVG